MYTAYAIAVWFGAIKREKNKTKVKKRVNCIFATGLNRYCGSTTKKTVIANLPLKTV
jgi:hypothetical protein